ncbi:malate synthase [Sporosarcina ureilytica]|uniref:Malate synthase n=1 Tax=Sporosarcina ureilytica TaxID=298596 RepID=A0A1D8JKF0_9BACL|nr:malate synthase [Sporosarcina ureilytica]
MLTYFRCIRSKILNKESGLVNLINEEITHKVFGEGNIVGHEESVITVDFNEKIKKFVYPDAFGEFITLNDRSVAKSLEKIFLKREKKEEALLRKRKEEQERLALEQQLRDKLKNNRIHESSQIVFWLDVEEQQHVFTDWQVSTGTIQSGVNKGQPNRAARLRPNSAGLLTVRGAEQRETERQILGLYMVNEAYSGNLSEDGMVPSHAEFRIQLSDQEAEEMLFWNYYINQNHPHRTSWNSGKYRYFDNVWTAQILKDIIALRTDEEQIKEAQRFLEYFCQMNALDMNNIPEANGALKQS